MHYYKRNIGDYHKKAGRLSMLEHGSYTLLIDACYDRERFPTMEEAIEWTWARSDEEIAAVRFVLSKFFTLTDGIYLQARIAEEIENYRANSLKNKEIALAREEARRAKRERNEHEACTNLHLTINQEPLTKNQEQEDQNTCDQQAESRAAAIPYAEIFDAYAAQLPELPQLRLKDDARKKAIKSLWHKSEKFQTPDFWSRYYGFVRESQFLMGMNGIGFDWLMKPANFKKVLEGNYHGGREDA